MAWIRHESGEQTVIKNQQALGPESPLETDEDGYAEVEDDDAADMLATLDTHVQPASPPVEDDSDDGSDDDICGFEKDDGSVCQRTAGWGRDADTGRCSDHYEE